MPSRRAKAAAGAKPAERRLACGRIRRASPPKAGRIFPTKADRTSPPKAGRTFPTKASRTSPPKAGSLSLRKPAALPAGPGCRASPYPQRPPHVFRLPEKRLSAPLPLQAQTAGHAKPGLRRQEAAARKAGSRRRVRDATSRQTASPSRKNCRIRRAAKRSAPLPTGSYRPARHSRRKRHNRFAAGPGTHCRAPA